MKKTFKKLKEEAISARDEKVKKLNLKADSIEEMTAEEFYRSLTPQRQFKLIRKGKKLKAYDKDETAVSDNEEIPQVDSYVESVESQESDGVVKSNESFNDVSVDKSHKELSSSENSKLIIEDDGTVQIQREDSSEDFPEEGAYVRNIFEDANGKNILDECD